MSRLTAATTESALFPAQHRRGSTHRIHTLPGTSYGARWGVVGHGGARWGAVGHGGARWGAVGCGGVRWDAVGHGGAWWGAMGHGGAWWGRQFTGLNV